MTRMFNANKLKIMLALIALIMCISTVQQTYAKYVSSASANTKIAVARWRILVNDVDIHTGAETEQLITPVIDNNDYVAEGKVAPESTGYFDIKIDSTNTDTSFNYQISMSDSTIRELVVTGYTLNNGSLVSLNGSNTISNNVLHTDTVKVNNIRVYFKWDDSLNVMDNSADTDASYSESEEPVIKATLRFVQLS